MKQNVGTFDKVVRFAIAALLLLAGALTVGTNPTVGTVLFVLAAVSAVTGLVGFCGLYTLFGINTCPVKLENKVTEKSE
jgi:hypothetical protein